MIRRDPGVVTGGVGGAAGVRPPEAGGALESERDEGRKRAGFVASSAAPSRSAAVRRFVGAICHLAGDLTGADAACIHLDGVDREALASWLRPGVLPEQAPCKGGSQDGIGQSLVDSPMVLTLPLDDAGAPGMRLCLCRRDPGRPFLASELLLATDLLKVPLAWSMVRVCGGGAVADSSALRAGDIRGPTPPDDALLEILTRREWEVVAAANCGSSNAQIAEQLGIGVETVRSHLHRALAKLGQKGRRRVETPAPVNGPAGKPKTARSKAVPTLLMIPDPIRPQPPSDTSGDGQSGASQADPEPD